MKKDYPRCTALYKLVMYFPPGRQHLQCYKILSCTLVSSYRIFQKVPLLSNTKAANSYTV